MSNKIPLVSIGIPTYNRINLLDEAIKCAVNQTYKNLEIIISDNNSPGKEVENLVKSYMDKDKRIIFKKHPINIAINENFKYVLSKAKGDYFLFAADDDVRSLDFIEKNLEFLEANHDYIASTSPTKFENREFDKVKMGVESLDNEDPNKRILHLVKHWHANGRFSSLYKMKFMDNAFDADLFLGNDWYVIARLLKEGKYKLIDDGWVVLGKSGISFNNIFRLARTKPIEFIFPFWVLTIFLFKLINSANLKLKINLFYKMMRLNFSAFKLNTKRELYMLYKRLLKLITILPNNN